MNTVGLGPVEIIIALVVIVVLLGVPIGLAIFLLKQRRKGPG